MNGTESELCAHCGKPSIGMGLTIDGELVCTPCGTAYERWLQVDGERSITDESGLL